VVNLPVQPAGIAAFGKILVPFIYKRVSLALIFLGENPFQKPLLSSFFYPLEYLQNTTILFFFYSQLQKVPIDYTHLVLP
jgi:hypothetical protein